MSKEIQYALLILGLFIVPRALQRFRLPSAITSVGLGALVSIGFHLFHDDSTIKLLATLGIVSMFLFAGLEVNLRELYENRRVLAQHVAIQLAVLAAGSLAAAAIFGLEVRAALLFALALLTPSTGFILDSLSGFGLSTDERFWVKSKAIASELVALGVLFLTIRSEDVTTLGGSGLALVAIVIFLPPLFRTFARHIAPYAPKTEFTFLIILALLCAFATRELGVYYLVGAFVVGVSAVRLRDELPELSSEKLLTGVEFFAAFFIPFYFFKAGLHLSAEYFTLRSFGIAFALLAIVLPVQVFRVAAHRHVAMGESWRTGARIGLAVVPTLVFTIVLAEILQEQFALPPELFGALIIFTLVNTAVPGFILRAAPVVFETPDMPAPAPSPARGVPEPAPEVEPVPEVAPPPPATTESGTLSDWFLGILGGTPGARGRLVASVLHRATLDPPGRHAALVLAVALVTLGLVLDSAMVVVAAAMLSPLGGATTRLAMGLATGMPYLVMRSAGQVLVTAVAGVGVSTLIALLLPFHERTAAVAAQMSPTMLHLVTAAFAGLAGVHACLRADSMPARVAVRAILGIVLLPAICAIGVGLGASDWVLVSGAAVAFLTLVVTTVVVATLAFSASGFGRVDGRALEGELFHAHRGAGVVRFGAARLAVFFDSKRGNVFRVLMPVILLASVFVPLKAALDDVAWEYRVRATIRATIAREPRRVMQSRVRVEKGGVEAVVVLLGNTQDAESLRGRLDAEVRVVAGVAPHVEVYAVPDANAFAGLEASIRVPVPPTAPGSLDSHEPAPPPLEAARTIVVEAVERAWPTATAGRPLMIELGVADTLRVTHLGPGLDPVARESVERALLMSLARRLTLLDAAVAPGWRSPAQGESAFLDALGTSARALVGVEGAAICVEAPPAPSRGAAARQRERFEQAVAASLATGPAVRRAVGAEWRAQFVVGDCPAAAPQP
jgi:Kef-type K+ transport system membrane component KefB